MFILMCITRAGVTMVAGVKGLEHPMHHGRGKEGVSERERVWQRRRDVVTGQAGGRDSYAGHTHATYLSHLWPLRSISFHLSALNHSLTHPTRAFSYSHLHLSSHYATKWSSVFFFSTVSLVCVYSINQLVSSVCLSVCLSHRQFPTVLVHPRTAATPDDHLILPYYLHHLQDFYAHDVGRKKFHCWWTLPEIWQV